MQGFGARVLHAERMAGAKASGQEEDYGLQEKQEGQCFWSTVRLESVV